MLVSFSFQNWMSFRDETEFSMKAGREKQHHERLASISDYDLKLLPVSAVYGGNASGKSNFVAALALCKEFICGDGFKPGKAIPVSAFRLDRECATQPTRFSVTLLADNDKVYEYAFSVTRECVHEETLIRYGTKPADDVTIYHRVKDVMTFDLALPAEDQFRFTIFKEGTHNNQLFLTNAISQKVKNEDLQAVYRWFSNNLEVLTPTSAVSLWYIYRQLNVKASPILSMLDTGIMRFAETEISSDDLKRQHPPDFLEFIRNQLMGANTLELYVRQIDTLFLLENDELKAIRLKTIHKSIDGEDVNFSLGEESDGTKRVIDLLPAFFQMSAQNSRRVFVIDEIDRSLHTLMIQSLIQAYLASSNENNRSQLVFTTHNVMLMDQDIFRRDEIWVAERQSQGQSKLFSFAEFKEVRNDTQIRKSYLQGRMGGIPNILLHGPF